MQEIHSEIVYDAWLRDRRRCHRRQRCQLGSYNIIDLMYGLQVNLIELAKYCVVCSEWLFKTVDNKIRKLIKSDQHKNVIKSILNMRYICSGSNRVLHFIVLVDSIRWDESAQW